MDVERSIDLTIECTGDTAVSGGLKDGVKAAMPVVLGYAPVGFAYGVLARGAGMTPVDSGAMSVLVYAGSAQFIGVGLIGAGTAPGVIIATTFLVNLRHLLFSASLSPRLKGVDPKTLALVGYGITDETFSVASATYPWTGGNPGFLLALNTVSNLSWILASIAGTIVGGRLGDPARLGLDYALTAMFICLLIFNLCSTGTYAAAAVSGILGLVLLPKLGAWSVMAAAIIGATVGMGVEEWKKRSS